MKENFIIFPSFLELKKNAKLTLSSKEMHRIAVLGDCATQHLCMALKGDAYRQGMKLSLYEADYNQILPQIMENSSEMYEFHPDIVLIWMCTEQLYEKFCKTASAMRDKFAEDTIVQIESYWQMIAAHAKVQLFQTNFIELNDRIFGNFANRMKSSFLFQVRKLNVLLMELSCKYKNVSIVDLSALSSSCGIEKFCDVKLYDFAKMPVAPDELPLITHEIIAMIYAKDGLGKKCIVLDLDNTLWGGVIGDDGMSGIQLGDLGAGHAFVDFQIWLKELKRRGILLAVCSKNEEKTAKEPFEKHPAMVLHLDDIALFVANWEDKASNIKKIQQTLNIGMNSIVFLDDNPFERNLVRQMIPDVIVPELPEDASQYVSYLKKLNLFETASYSKEDELRTSQYQADIGRNEFQKQFVSFDDYLKSLDMVAECHPFDSFHEPRIAQLTQRSNQFNLRTKRYSEQDISAFSTDSNYVTAYFTLSDKFGNHGLISVVIIKKLNNETMFVDTWLMSCRVLKRGMEEFIINKIVELAHRNGASKIIGEYIPTPKNTMVSSLYERFGFMKTADNRFELNIDQYQRQINYIKEK